VAKIVLLSLLFGLILLRTGSLWIPIGLHFAVDLAGILLAPWLLAPRR
jgi:membrane protease YdiL (CAAX protease family)